MRERFEEYMRRINREGIEDLKEWLVDTGFYKAPASTRHHLAEEGGLAEHSLNVVEKAIDLRNTLDPELELDSVIICSLFHDLGKHKYFNKDYYLEKPLLKSGKRPAQPYESNRDLINVPHEISSIHILSQFINLTEDETWAILQHNGMYSDLKYRLQGNETRLQMIVHWADMWASRVMEG